MRRRQSGDVSAADQEEQGKRQGETPVLQSIVFDSRHPYPTLDRFFCSASVADGLASQLTGALGSDEAASTDRESAATSPCPETLWKLSPPPKKVNQLLCDGSSECKAGSVIDSEWGNQQNQAEIDRHLPAFRAAATAIAAEFGLTLFGFDVLIPLPSDPASEVDRQVDSGSIAPFVLSRDSSVASSNSSDDNSNTRRVDGGRSARAATTASPQLVVIDVNYFPSYKDVKDFPARLRAFLRHKAGCSATGSNSEMR